MSQPEAPSRRPVDPYAVMRPRRGRFVAWPLAVIVLLGFAYAAATVARNRQEWGIADRVFLFVIGAGIAWFIWRFTTIKAVPDDDGLVVRNLLLTRRLDWPQILRVQFGGGTPWAHLDLTDADTVAVMAIQKADGDHAVALASRLAALVQVHSLSTEPEPRDSGPGRPDDTPPGAQGRA